MQRRITGITASPKYAERLIVRSERLLKETKEFISRVESLYPELKRGNKLCPSEKGHIIAFDFRKALRLQGADAAAEPGQPT